MTLDIPVKVPERKEETAIRVNALAVLFPRPPTTPVNPVLHTPAHKSEKAVSGG